LHFGVQYNGVSMGQVMGPLEFAGKVEAWGYDSFFVPDLETLPTLDALTVLASVAQKTGRLMLGTGVLVLPFRSPYQLAKAAASIEMLSNGRLILGLGTGGVIPKDFEVEQVSLRDRGSITDERLHILRRLLTEAHVSHRGRHHQFDNVTLEPKPIQRPHFPLWIGATWQGRFAGPAIRRTGRWGDGFHPHDTPVTGYAEAQDRIREQAALYDRDPDGIVWACNMWLCMGATKDRASRMRTRR
jgi:alkanesulfonate monooxygenase SsuD/methylene tetrahydromethanopterin reductase-like flavin-dependent oxidoreductase (luciferase family)